MFKLFALVLMTFILVSCGGGKSTATLSISRGMLLGNTSFSGGIYITGEKVGGTETFSAAITTGNQTSVSIPFGNWNFKVIGWDGGGMMSGTAYCKYVPNYSFTTEGQALEITTTAAECFSDSNISGTSQHITANVGPYKDFIFNTCGALYGPSNTSLLHAYQAFNPCDSYPVEFKKTYPYFQFHLVNQTVAGSRTPGIVSGCFGTQVGQSVLFPNRLPVTVKFYKDASCTTELDEYVFKKALDFSQSPTREANSFDWSVTSDTVHYFVTLATGPSKRGTTAFHSETPIFKCLDGSTFAPCTKYPSTTTGTYYVDPDKYAVIAASQSTCGAVTFSGLTATSVSCDVIDGKAYIGFKSAGLTPLTGSVSMNGLTQTVKVGNQDPTFPNDRTREAYKTLKRALGFRNSSAFDNSLQDDTDEGDNQRLGFLDPAIYEMSSMGAGGLFFDYYTQCTTTAISPISRAYVKNGISYTVNLSGISGVAPAFTARSEEPEFMGSEVHYNRRIVVRKLVGPNYETEKVIDFSCDNFDTATQNYVSNSAQVRNGKMEEQRSYSYGISPANKLVTLKKKIFWNTSSSDSARFDVYRTKVVTNSTGTNQKIERNYYRVAKSDSDVSHDFKVYSMNYETVRDGSAFDESISVNEIDGTEISGTVSYSHKRLFDMKVEDTSIGTIFTSQNFGAELNKVRYGYRPNDYELEQTKVSSSGDNFIEARRGTSNFEVRFTDSGSIQTQTLGGIADNIATDISNNGSHKIAVMNSGTNIVYIIVINGVASTGTYSATSTPVSIKAAILDNGTFAFAFLESGSLQKLRWVINGGAISDSPFTTYSHKSIEMTKDTSMIYLMHTRSSSSNTTQSLDICKMNGSLPCGFNTVASKVSGSPFSYATITAGTSNIYFTYIHNSQIHTINADSATLLNVSTPVYPNSYSFSPYENTFYTNLSESAALRTSVGTPVEIFYPYYNSAISGFEMKPIMLNSPTMNGLFTSSFSSITN